jgi:hypothetical protein
MNKCGSTGRNVWEIALDLLDLQNCVDFFFFLTVLGFKFRALCLLGGCSTACATPQPLHLLFLLKLWKSTLK